MSLEHFRSGASSSHEAEMWEEAKALLRAGEEDRAMKLFRQLADAGDWRASASIGFIFEGRGPKGRTNYVHAAHWYNNALAKEDRPEPHLGLARYYYFGLGGKRDLRLAYEHLSKADPEDNPEAALMMAELLYLGVAGVNPDISRAKQLLLSAADAGYPYAMLRLARIAKGDGRYMAFALLMLEGLLNALKLSWKNDKDARLLGMGGRHGRLVLEGVVARQSDPESEADNLQS